MFGKRRWRGKKGGVAKKMRDAGKGKGKIQKKERWAKAKVAAN